MQARLWKAQRLIEPSIADEGRRCYPWGYGRLVLRVGAWLSSVEPNKDEIRRGRLLTRALDRTWRVWPVVEHVRKATRMSTEFRLPGLGENVESGAVTKVMIAVGDTVMENQSVLEIETEKAALEVPSNVSGVVTEVRVKEGDVLRVGQVAFIVEATSVSVDPASRVLPVPEPPEPASVDVPPASETSGRHDAEQALPLARAAVRRGGPVAASPSVRQLAREIGVDINEVPSSEGGRVTAEDVKRHARGANVDTGGAVSRADAAAPLPARA